MIPLITRITTCLLILGATTAPVLAENWPNWRGPTGDGISKETKVPVKWSGTENIAWKTELPGVGHSSPIVWEDRIFTASAVEEDRVLLSLDRKTGDVLWKTTVVTTPREKLHRLNSWASGTPATDGELVYVAFLDRKDMVVAAFDFAGKQRWLVRPGAFSSRHGFCSCPVLYKDMVIVNGDHDGSSYLVALDRKTGETRWKTMREYKTRSYCTPIIREIDGRT
ncbi:MAG: PQQ-like beta-propeller repeat protein, partial [Planctomycetales bacterium]